MTLGEKVEKLPSVDKVVTLESFVPADQEEKLEIIDGINLSLGPLLEPRSGSNRPGRRRRSPPSWTSSAPSNTATQTGFRPPPRPASRA